MRIGTWNTQWANPSGKRGMRVRDLLAEGHCQILCITEGYAGLLPEGGSIIESDPDYGYKAPEGRRKVILWSQSEWVDQNKGPSLLPGGRFVTGVTDTAVGRLRIVGVCIPWRDAHVRTGRRDRVAWEDHLAFLKGFSELPYRSATERTVVLGDFNQRIPRRSTPDRIHTALLEALGHLEVATSGSLQGAPGPAIDHIAHTADLLRTGESGFWYRTDSDGKSLSDHFGVWCNLRRISAGS